MKKNADNMSATNLLPIVSSYRIKLNSFQNKVQCSQENQSAINHFINDNKQQQTSHSTSNIKSDTMNMNLNHATKSNFALNSRHEDREMTSSLIDISQKKSRHMSHTLDRRQPYDHSSKRHFLKLGFSTASI
jgi:hypothetical protein